MLALVQSALYSGINLIIIGLLLLPVAALLAISSIYFLLVAVWRLWGRHWTV